MVSVVSSLFVIYYLSCVFCSKLLPKSAIQYLLMGVFLMMSKNPGKSSPWAVLASARCGCVPRIPACMYGWSQVPSLVLSVLGFRAVSVKVDSVVQWISKTRYSDKLHGGGIFAFWGSRQIITRGSKIVNCTLSSKHQILSWGPFLVRLK